MTSETLRKAVAADFDRARRNRSPRRQEIAAACEPKRPRHDGPETVEEWRARGGRIEVLPGPQDAPRDRIPARLSFRGKGSAG